MAKTGIAAQRHTENGEIPVRDPIDQNTDAFPADHKGFSAVASMLLSAPRLYATSCTTHIDDSLSELLHIINTIDPLNVIAPPGKPETY